MGNRRLPFVDSDGWLAPVADKIEARHERFIARLERIRESAGSLTDYANGYRYFGLTRDDAAGGWWFREWALKRIGMRLPGAVLATRLLPAGTGMRLRPLTAGFYR